MLETVTERADSVRGWPSPPTPAEREAQGLPRLHRPWRGLVVIAELIAAGLLVWAAFAFWSAAISTVTMVLSDGTRLVSTRYAGNWIGGAIGLGTVAALLLVDAVRQSLLTFYARHRSKKSTDKTELSESFDDPDSYGAHAKVV